MSDVDLNGRHVSGVAMCFFLPNYVILLITSALNGYGVVGGGLAWHGCLVLVVGATEAKEHRPLYANLESVWALKVIHMESW